MHPATAANKSITEWLGDNVFRRRRGGTKGKSLGAAKKAFSLLPKSHCLIDHYVQFFNFSISWKKGLIQLVSFHFSRELPPTVDATGRLVNFPLNAEMSHFVQ